MKKTILSLSLLGALSFFAASCGNENKTEDSKEVAQEQNDTKFDDTNIEDDTKWATNAAEGGMLEVQLGNLAQMNGASQQVKDLGKMMSDDHSKANEELKALAARKNVSLPTTLGDAMQKDYNDLAEKKGTDFDKAYADFMVSHHKKTIEEFQKEGNDGKDPDMKAWAAGKVPTLQHHLQMAESTQEAVKK